MNSSTDRGWKFPVRVDSSTGRILMSSGVDDIHEAVLIIVKTIKKERKMRPGFGSNINKYAFEVGNASTMTLIEEDIRRAIENWEPRVTDVEVGAHYDERNQEKIIVEVSYRVISQNLEYSKTIEIEA